MSKIVVTGGAGFIGSHIAERLSKDGHEVIIIDNMDNYYPIYLKNNNIKIVLEHENTTFINADVTDFHKIQEIIDDTVDYVYHEAAQAGVRISVDNPFKSNNVNILGTLNVLKAAVNSEVKKVINASSSSVYGKVKYLPFDEQHPTEPVSPYGASKLAAEHYCRIFYEIYGLPTTSLRYFTVYGPRMRPDLAISIFTQKMLVNEQITVFGNGEQTRDFTYISDIVEANVKLLTNKLTNGKVLNIGSCNNVSVNNLLDYLKFIIGIEPKIVHSNKQMGDTQDTLADVSFAKNLLGYEPKINLENGLEMFVDWFISNAKN